MKYIQIHRKNVLWRQSICLFVLISLVLSMSPRPTMAKENVQTDWTRRVITHTITNSNSKLLHFRFMDQNEQEVSLTENSTSLQSDSLTQGHTSAQSDPLTQGHTSLQSDSLTQSPSTDLSSAALQSFRLTAPIRSALKGDQPHTICVTPELSLPSKIKEIVEHVGHLALSNQQNPMPFAKVS